MTEVITIVLEEHVAAGQKPSQIRDASFGKIFAAIVLDKCGRISQELTPPEGSSAKSLITGLVKIIQELIEIAPKNRFFPEICYHTIITLLKEVNYHKL